MATDDEIIRAIDAVVQDGDIPFREVWDTRTDDERATLLRLASASSPGALDQAAIELARDGYLERNGSTVTIAVPMFRDWIRMYRLLEAA